MLKNLIDGRFDSASRAEAIAILNPSTGEKIGEFPDSPAAAVQDAIAAAKRVQPAWAALPAIQRARHLHRIAALIREKRDLIATTIAREQGKLLSLAEIEADFTADYVDYMAEWARRIEGEIIPSDRPNETIFLFRKPIGVVGGILPWNFPFFLFARKMAPALITGNTIVIKPSEETPLNAEIFAQIIVDSELPAGVVNVVHGRGAIVGEAITHHSDIGLITFTGSTRAGSAIMAAASQNVTRVSLELGGKAPAIVMADCDLDLAVRAVTTSRLTNNGQVCNCAERIYVQAAVADEFVDRLGRAFAEVTYGDPLGNAGVGMGPLINRAAVDRVQAMVDRAVSQGARVEAGGSADTASGGFFFKPTVLANCEQGMEIMHQEVFGPVAPVSVFHDLDEAIANANDCEYGLTSSIYTRDLRTAMRASNELLFGETYINRENFEAIQGFHAGWRKSGIGGGDGKHGVYEFTQTRVVYLQL
jgi:lactaldehyde dehydrogenase / glycolaldehyde dehydrogenase